MSGFEKDSPWQSLCDKGYLDDDLELTTKAYDFIEAYHDWDKITAIAFIGYISLKPSLTTPEPTYRIKALEWRKIQPELELYSANTVFGGYIINSRSWAFTDAIEGKLSGDNSATMDESKSACQSHHRSLVEKMLEQALGGIIALPPNDNEIADAAEAYFESLCITFKARHYPVRGFIAGAKWALNHKPKSK
jgi:hypothetical protein